MALHHHSSHHHHQHQHQQSLLQQQQSNGVPALSPSHHPNGVQHRPPAPTSQPSEALQSLAQANEKTWLLIGNIAEQMQDPDRAESAYEHALRHNPDSITALTQVASIARARDDFVKAIDFFQRALDLRQDNGEVWSALGHCYLMQDDLQKAYAAYQQALYYLTNPKDPKLWYGIGILYDRYGSLEHAEEAFASVLRMDENFEKADEIHFRLGIIYKQQGKYPESLDCFDRILRNPPSPLANVDIWFQIGHVYEQQKDYNQAKAAYERVLTENPNHAKVLQQLGWLYHQAGSTFQNQDLAINCLTKSLEADGSDAQSWYLLGRAYMAVQKYQKAYEAYQQAVYRDGRNPTFWCSIGVLYYNINQYRDALDAYSRAIRINPYIPEVWFDLGSLYESCNNQISDAIDAYARAADLDPNNQLIKQRLRLLKDVQANGGQMPAAPGPQDVHPTAYASGHGPPTMMLGGPSSHASLAQQSQQAPPSSSGRPGHHPSRSDSRGPMNGIASGSDHHGMSGLSGRELPAPPLAPGGRRSPDLYRHEAEPFRGGPPPPLNISDEPGGRRLPGHTPLAPMDVDRHGPPHHYDPARSSGPSSSGHPSSLLLHHPQPQPPSQPLASMQPPPPPHQQPFSSRSYESSQSSHDGPPRRISPALESPPRGNVGGSSRQHPMNSAPSPSPSYDRAGPPGGYGGPRSYPSSTSANPALPPPTQSSHYGLPYDRPNAGSTSSIPERGGESMHWESGRRDRHGHMKSDSRGGGPELAAPQHYSHHSRSPAPPQGSSGPPPGYHPSQHRGGPPPPHHQSQPPYERRAPSPGGHRGGPPPNAEHPPDRRDNRSPYPGGYSSYYGHQGPPPHGHHIPSPAPSHRPPSAAGPPRRYDPRMDNERRDWERDAPPPPPPSHHEPPAEHARNSSPDLPSRGRPTSSANHSTNGVGKWREPEPASRGGWPRESESPRPGSARPSVAASTPAPAADPPKERKRRGKAGVSDKEPEPPASTGKAPKEKRERKAPAKRGAAAKAALQEREDQATSPTPIPPMSSQPFDWSRPPQPPLTSSAVHRPTRSVDEDYDADSQENEGTNALNEGANALIGLAQSRPPLPAPLLPHRQSSGRLEGLLNGPSQGPNPTRSPPMTQRPSARSDIDRLRSPGRTATPLKRLASDDHEDAAEPKRSRMGNQRSNSSVSSSPPGPGTLQAILSPPTSRSPDLQRGNRSSGLGDSSQSRRASMDVNGNSRSGGPGGRGWGHSEERMDVDLPPVQVGGASSSNGAPGKPSMTTSPHHSLPPIATLPPAPPTPPTARLGQVTNGRRSGSASLTPVTDDHTSPAANGENGKAATSPKASSPRQSLGGHTESSVPSVAASS